MPIYIYMYVYIHIYTHTYTFNMFNIYIQCIQRREYWGREIKMRKLSFESIRKCLNLLDSLLHCKRINKPCLKWLSIFFLWNNTSSALRNSIEIITLKGLSMAFILCTYMCVIHMLFHIYQAYSVEILQNWTSSKSTAQICWWKGHYQQSEKTTHRRKYAQIT